MTPSDEGAADVRGPVPQVPPKPQTPAWLAAQSPPAGGVTHESPTPTRLLRDPRAWLVVYAVVLALIAFWPTHVDQGMGPFLQEVTHTIPILTYARIEFGANIVLFVPLGALLMLILRQRSLIMPIALVVTVSIECIQSLMGPSRTASVHDVLANVTGAALGMLLVAAAGWVARRTGG